jgi:hypothetical protein
MVLTGSNKQASVRFYGSVEIKAGCPDLPSYLLQGLTPE